MSVSKENSMTLLLRRRALIGLAAASPLLFACGSIKPTDRAASAVAQLLRLERNAGGRLGVAGVDTGDGSSLTYRADERFPMCSTFKVLAAAAVLERSVDDRVLLEQRIRYSQDALVENSPVTTKNLRDGMTVARLCAAAIQYSDNTAGNLLLELLGGPAALTAYARSLGDPATRLDRIEPRLNTAIPGDERDTTTPAAMLADLRRLVLGDVLPIEQREVLKTWLIGNTTGGQRIRAAVPAGWQVGDKTGTGSNGAANDIAVVWPPGRPPLVLAIYCIGSGGSPQERNEVVASAARVAIAAWSLPA